MMHPFLESNQEFKLWMIGIATEYKGVIWVKMVVYLSRKRETTLVDEVTP